MKQGNLEVIKQEMTRVNIGILGISELKRTGMGEFNSDDYYISGSSAFSKTSLNIWKFTVHVLLEFSLKDFEHYIASMWNECNCAVV